ncbi:MAG: FAD-binding oxidoreductase [Caulobacteraceae bacterium]|nr:FAD-binding oxidoreductase [Caulobacteraceae bacterium]
MAVGPQAYSKPMKTLSNARIIVIGAGVLGLSSALALERRGAKTQVFDPYLGRTSASAAAAGMIAPGLEAGLESVSAETAALYLEAAARWPAHAERYGLSFVRDGTDWIGPVDPLAERLDAIGVPWRPLRGGAHLPGEARVDVGQALERMRSALTGPVKQSAAQSIEMRPEGVRVTAGGQTFDADAAVLAAGWSAGSIDLGGSARVDGLVSPVKGQILLLDGAVARAVERTTRGPGCYLTPSHAGLIVGATMEPGRSDTDVDDVVVANLRSEASRLFEGLESARLVRAWCGVRGASPDGLPLVGATTASGIFAALAPRRNGWLLGPLAGEVLAASLAGELPNAAADAFRPDRFDPA